MSPALGDQLRAALRGTSLEAKLEANAGGLLERHGKQEVRFRDERVVRGFARAVASQAETARFFSNRSRLLERFADLEVDTLRSRLTTLPPEPTRPGDLETFLDELRLLRREEGALVACLDLGECASLEQVSQFLSALAEVILARALRAARRFVSGSEPSPPLGVIGMGKIAGREFTYHSDLDLVFLYEGGPDAVMLVSRVVQRTIAYLGTMTGAGVAYAVDTRLRPSGQQGTLVTSFDAFERYQQERAELWEHLALMRARAIGGESARSDRVLEGVRGALFRARPTPWRYVADVRGRIEQERAREGAAAIDLKTGSGGLVDVEFLAQAGMLERGHERVFPPVPSIPALLRSAQSGPNVDRLLEQYAFLRRVEARARWLAGRGVDRLTRDSGDLAALAELVETGWSGERLWERVASAREAVRAAFVRVIEAETIRALDG